MEDYIVFVIFILTMISIIVLSYFKNKNVEKKISNIIKEYNFTQKGFNITNDKNSFEKKLDKGRHAIWITNDKNGYITLNVAIEFKPSTQIELQSFFEKIKFNTKIAKKYKSDKIEFFGQRTAMLLKVFEIKKHEKKPDFKEIENTFLILNTIIKNENLNY